MTLLRAFTGGNGHNLFTIIPTVNYDINMEHLASAITGRSPNCRIEDVINLIQSRSLVALHHSVSGGLLWNELEMLAQNYCANRERDEIMTIIGSLLPDRVRKCRRFAEMKRREQNGYFELAEIKERCPELYELYVGQYDTRPDNYKDISDCVIHGDTTPGLQKLEEYVVRASEVVTTNQTNNSNKSNNELVTNDDDFFGGPQGEEEISDEELPQHDNRIPIPLIPSDRCFKSAVDVEVTNNLLHISEDEQQSYIVELQQLMMSKFITGADQSLSPSDYLRIDTFPTKEDSLLQIADNEDLYFEETPSEIISYSDAVLRMRRSQQSTPPPCDESNNWGW